MKPTLDGLMGITTVYGINMKLDGGDIVLWGDQRPPANALEALHESKDMLVEFLSGKGEFWKD